MSGRRKDYRRIGIALASLVLIPLACAGIAHAQAAEASPALPSFGLNIGGTQMGSDGTVSSSLKIMLLLTILSFAPAMVITMTCFTRIAVVLGMTRTALGTQSMPPNMVITGLAMFLTIAIMNPVFSTMYNDGIKPFMEGQMNEQEAMVKSFAPLKRFLIRHAREKDLALFLDITNTAIPSDVNDVPFQVAVPAFVLSELNLAFQIGFLIALPFLVLDMVVSSVLTSMSMITLPPVVISLPLKLMLFVIVDGWHLIIGSLVATYHVT
ncbi:MAG: flagellar type III secretion system pore protein FliP [Deltaproteobacteria bacterium]|nr:flagellar type III secretion system pore protein FliP [Deltaproteobacteria bacterium]